VRNRFVFSLILAAFAMGRLTAPHGELPGESAQAVPLPELEEVAPPGGAQAGVQDLSVHPEAAHRQLFAGGDEGLGLSLVEEAQALVKDRSLEPSTKLLSEIDGRIWELSYSLARVRREIGQDKWLRPVDYLHSLPAYAALSERDANYMDTLVNDMAPVHLAPEEIPRLLGWYKYLDSLDEYESILEMDVISMVGLDRWCEGVKKMSQLYPHNMRPSAFDFGDDEYWEITFGIPCPVKEYLE